MCSLVAVWQQICLLSSPASPGLALHHLEAVCVDDWSLLLLLLRCSHPSIHVHVFAALHRGAGSV